MAGPVAVIAAMLPRLRGLKFERMLDRMHQEKIIAAMLPRLRGLKLKIIMRHVSVVFIAAMLPRLRGLKCLKPGALSISLPNCSDVAPIEGTEILRDTIYTCYYATIAAMLPRLRGLKLSFYRVLLSACYDCSDVAPIEGTEICIGKRVV